MAGSQERDSETGLKEVIQQLSSEEDHDIDSSCLLSHNTFQASTDSLDSAEDFTPVEINLGEIKEMLSMYMNKRRISTSVLTGAKK